jgi:hypothetical protein
MIKLIGTMHRKDGMSVEDYQAYWLSVTPDHRRGARSAPLHPVTRCRSLRRLSPGLRRYGEAWSTISRRTAPCQPAVAGGDRRRGELHRHQWSASWSARCRSSTPTRRPATALMVKYCGFTVAPQRRAVPDALARRSRTAGGQRLKACCATSRTTRSPRLRHRQRAHIDGVPQAWFSLEAVPPGLGRRATARPPRPPQWTRKGLRQPIQPRLREIVIVD